MNDVLLLCWALIKEFLYYGFFYALILVIGILPLVDYLLKKITNRDLFSRKKVFNAIMVSAFLVPLYLTLTTYFHHKNYKSGYPTFIEDGEYINTKSGKQLLVKNDYLYFDCTYPKLEYKWYRINKDWYASYEGCDPYNDFLGNCYMLYDYQVSIEYDKTLTLYIRTENEDLILQGCRGKYIKVTN